MGDAANALRVMFTQEKSNMSRPASIRSTKLRSLIGVVAFTAMSASVSAAPIGAMGELARSNAPAATKVVQRHHYISQGRNNNRQARKHNSDDPRPNSDWHDLDSNNLPFGSSQWWDQHWTENNGH